MPDDFDLTIDYLTCGCDEESDMLLSCQPQVLFATLAEKNTLPALNELGKLAYEKGQVVDINIAGRSLVIYD